MPTNITLTVTFKEGAKLLYNETFETIEDAVDIAEDLVTVQENHKDIHRVSIRWRNYMIMEYRCNDDEWQWI